MEKIYAIVEDDRSVSYESSNNLKKTWGKKSLDCWIEGTAQVCIKFFCSAVIKISPKYVFLRINRVVKRAKLDGPIEEKRGSHKSTKYLAIAAKVKEQIPVLHEWVRIPRPKDRTCQSTKRAELVRMEKVQKSQC